MDGQEVFERMAQKYADCQTYSDSGRVEGSLGVVTFKTYFVRPLLFKFEFTRRLPSHDSSAVLWSDGIGLYERYDQDEKPVLNDSFANLFTEAGSASQGASYLVPMLLMPDFAGPGALANAGPFQEVEHTTIADRSCFRLRSMNDVFSFKVDLLIDRLGYKLRKMLIEYNPELNAEIIFNDVSFDREISEDVFKVPSLKLQNS